MRAALWANTPPWQPHSGTRAGAATAARRGQRVDLRLTQRVRATQTGSRPRAAAVQQLLRVSDPRRIGHEQVVQSEPGRAIHWHSEPLCGAVL